MSTQDILHALHEMPEAPWGDLRGKPINGRGLSSRQKQYGIASKQIRGRDWTGKGYSREDLHDAWVRYLPQPQRSETSETRETRQANSAVSVSDVSDVSKCGTKGRGEASFEERAAILEYEGGLSRADAEAQARAERGR